MPQQRCDNRGAGDRQDGANQGRDADIVSQHHHHENGGQRERQPHRQRAEPEYGQPGFPEFAKLQGQPTLEQDDRHKQPDRRKQRIRVTIACGKVVVDVDAGDPPEAKAERQQQQDRRKFEFPSQPLCADAESKDPGKIDKGRHPQGSVNQPGSHATKNHNHNRSDQVINARESIFPRPAISLWIRTGTG